MRPPIKLVVPKICRDCGMKITTDIELDTHDLHCPGPIQLFFDEDGNIYGEVPF